MEIIVVAVILIVLVLGLFSWIDRDGGVNGPGK
jgi:hypothetical protein